MFPRRALELLVLASLTLAAAGCYQQVSGDQALELTSTKADSGVIPTATPILNLPAPVILSVSTPAPLSPTAVPPLPGTPDPVAAVTEREPAETPTSEPTPVPTLEPTAVASDGTEGFPFTRSALVSAIAARGLAYGDAGAHLGCDGRAAEVRQLDGPDGPPFSLWVYAAPDDLKADWVLPSSGAPSPRIAGCEIDGGWIYWSENLVLAFEPQVEWIPEASVREAIVSALWSLTR